MGPLMWGLAGLGLLGIPYTVREFSDLIDELSPSDILGRKRMLRDLTRGREESLFDESLDFGKEEAFQRGFGSGLTRMGNFDLSGLAGSTSLEDMMSQADLAGLIQEGRQASMARSQAPMGYADELNRIGTQLGLTGRM